MKKIVIFILTVALILPFSILFTGCSNKQLTVNFYDTELNIISSKQYAYQKMDNSGNYGVYNKNICAPNAPILTGYDNVGWHMCSYGEVDKEMIPKSIWDFDEDVWFSSDLELRFVVAYEISNNGWHYVGEESGNNLNAFRWTGSSYTSPALQLLAGDNYIRFDKTTTEYALKYCKVFENGSSNVGHISNVIILDNNAFPINDIDLSANIWENQTLQTNKTGSFIIKITTTKAFEAGILIGEDIT